MTRPNVYTVIFNDTHEDMAKFANVHAAKEFVQALRAKNVPVDEEYSGLIRIKDKSGANRLYLIFARRKPFWATLIQVDGRSFEDVWADVMDYGSMPAPDQKNPATAVLSILRFFTIK